MFHKNFGPDTPQLFKGHDLDDTIFPLGVNFFALRVFCHKNAHTWPSLQHAQRRHGHGYRRRNNTLIDQIGPLASLPDNCCIEPIAFLQRENHLPFRNILLLVYRRKFHSIIAIDNAFHKVVKPENPEDALRVLKKHQNCRRWKKLNNPAKRHWLVPRHELSINQCPLIICGHLYRI